MASQARFPGGSSDYPLVEAYRILAVDFQRKNRETAKKRPESNDSDLFFIALFEGGDIIAERYYPDSLNLGVATSILLYEAYRQRSTP